MARWPEWTSRTSAAAGDDKIRPFTRGTAMLIVPVLLIAFGLLYPLPDKTELLFVWTIQPPFTAMLLAAIYLAGAYFFARIVGGVRWHWVAVEILPTATFTWLLGLATLLHWDRFNHSHLLFPIWAVLYAVLPFLLPAVWWQNRAADPGTLDPGDLVVPVQVRGVVAAVTAVNLVVAVVLFTLPTLGVAVWPWTLTPLTARVLAGWFVLFGLIDLGLVGERRWSAWRLPAHTQMIGLTLVLVAAIRAWGEFNPNNPLTWVFLGGSALSLMGTAALYTTFEGRRRPVGAAR